MCVCVCVCIHDYCMYQHYILIYLPFVSVSIYNKTYVRGFFDTDLHEVSWHFATHEAMTAHCFGALSQVRAIGHCVIGQERDLLFPDWLNKWVCPWVATFEIQIFLTP